jgi:hypothetical protein
VGCTSKPKVGVGEGEAVAEVGSGVGVGTGVNRRGAKVGVEIGATSEGLGDSGVNPGKRRALHAVSTTAARDASASAHDRFLRGPGLEARILCFTHSPGDESKELAEQPLLRQSRQEGGTKYRKHGTAHQGQYSERSAEARPEAGSDAAWDLCSA